MVPLLGLALSVLAQTGVSVVSPDGSNRITVSQDGSEFDVTRNGDPVIAPSPLGLELAGQAPWRRLALRQRRDTIVDRRLTKLIGKTSSARDHYRQSTLAFVEQGKDGRRLTLEVRAFDDGVAFRYVMNSDGPIMLSGESTGFRLDPHDQCLASRTNSSHEATFDALNAGKLVVGVRYDVPVVCTTASTRTGYAIAQADLSGYAGASLLGTPAGLKVDLSPVPNRTGPAFVGGRSITTAWRVVMLGDSPGTLIASNLIGNLSPPPAEDFSWVRPGKAAWDWWSGPLAGMTATTANYRRFIDFAAAQKLPYYLIDAGWALGSGPCCDARPETDVTRAAVGVDMPALVRYASDKGVRLLLWVHWKHLEGRMDEVLDTYRRWSIAGVKVDFMERDDQVMVAFYRRLAAATARRHLLLDLHGAYPPEGLNRTFPNYITQEGVLGAEYNKLGRLVTARHNVSLAYTRMLLGPMDYTPGGMRSVLPSTYTVHDVAPLVQSTRGQALAMYVVYDSPLQMVADAPEAYADADGFDFIRSVPTTWDETRFVAGETGRSIVLARRHGNVWYVGAMTDDTGRVLDVPLTFLSEGRYRAAIRQDGETPTTLVHSQREVGRSDRLSLALAPSGGSVVTLTPVR